MKVFWQAYYKAKEEHREKPKFKISGNGVMSMEAKDLVQSKAWQRELNTHIKEAR